MMGSCYGCGKRYKQEDDDIFCSSKCSSDHEKYRSMKKFEEMCYEVVNDFNTSEEARNGLKKLIPFALNELWEVEEEDLERVIERVI